MKIGTKILLLAIALALFGFAVGNFSSDQESLGLAGLIIVATVAAVLLARHLTQPLQQLLGWLDQVAIANLSESSPSELPEPSLEAIAHRRDEIGAVSRSLQGINQQFSNSINRLQATAAEKERMETELRIGRSIQMDLLALGSATFPTHKDLALFADLQPAREVGGDFYDCYFLPEQLSNLLRDYAYRFCFCIGDTSGKGVPAALFTTVMKTMVKSQSYVDPSPAKVLTRVNQVISENNPSCMFTTLFLGVLNLLSGELTYTLAGHNPPYLRHADGSLEKLSELHGPAVGVISNVEYKEAKILCQTGDMLIAYTDGVTEAMDIEGRLFSDERFLNLLMTEQYDSPQDAIRLISETITQFQGEAEQADDITMLSFKYLGNPLEAGEFSEFSILEAALSSIKQNTLNG